MCIVLQIPMSNTDVRECLTTCNRFTEYSRGPHGFWHVNALFDFRHIGDRVGGKQVTFQTPPIKLWTMPQTSLAEKLPDRLQIVLLNQLLLQLFEIVICFALLGTVSKQNIHACLEIVAQNVRR